MTSGPLLLPLQGFRWTGTYILFSQSRWGTDLGGGEGLTLGLHSLQLGKGAESGLLVRPELQEFIEDCRERRRRR